MVITCCWFAVVNSLLVAFLDTTAVTVTHLFLRQLGFVVSGIDLDLDSSRIQLDTLDHTPTPSVSVKNCHLYFLPGEPHLS